MYQDYTRFSKKWVWFILILVLCAIGAYFGYQWTKKNEKPLLLATVPIVPTMAAPESTVNAPFEEGKHYLRYSAKVTTSTAVQALINENPGQVQVLQFFNYGCFWCQRLHPLVNEWLTKKPSNVVFLRFPLVWNKNWEVLAKAFFMTKALGKPESIDMDFFTAIHQNSIDLGDEKRLQQFFVQQGLTEQQFLDLYNSFAINRELARSNELGNAYEITASPVIIINSPSGSYLITAAMAGSEQAVISVLDFLLSKDSTGG